METKEERYINEFIQLNVVNIFKNSKRTYVGAPYPIFKADALEEYLNGKREWICPIKIEQDDEFETESYYSISRNEIFVITGETSLMQMVHCMIHSLGAESHFNRFGSNMDSMGYYIENLTADFASAIILSMHGVDKIVDDSVSLISYKIIRDIIEDDDTYVRLISEVDRNIREFFKLVYDL